MVKISYPGVYTAETPSGVRTISGVPTSIAAFVGATDQGEFNKASAIHRFADFERTFGGLNLHSPLSYAVRQFFLNGGSEALVVRTGSSPAELVGSPTAKTGLYALLDADLFNLLVIPDTFDMTDGQEAAVITAAVSLCEARRAFYIVDAPANRTLTDIVRWANGVSRSCNAATYFPAVRIADPLDGNQPRAMAPSGSLAGLYARTDSNRGVWKSPAGTEASLNGVTDLTLTMNDGENGQLNPQGVNALRSFPMYGRVAWGARTLRGGDAFADEYKYIATRRLALFLEESMHRGTQWAVFEPNDDTLWAQLRLTVGAFMNSLFRQGAFHGETAREGYFVKCDQDTTTQNDRNLGVVNISVGFAPLKPGEFVVLDIRLNAAMAG